MQAVKAQPWAQELSKKTPGMLIMLFEDLTYRQVFLDGRPLPKDPNPTWMGYSVGHWDGDTLVVESAGFNDRTWLDGDGHPHTEDPKALARPWVIPIKLEFNADTEMIEYVCAENERDHGHLVGKAADDKNLEVKVALEILKQYVGTYELKPPTRPEDPIPIRISLDESKLMVSISGGAKHALTALSETKFYFEGAHLEFVKDEHGVVTHLLLQVVEGDFKAQRK